MPRPINCVEKRYHPQKQALLFIIIYHIDYNAAIISSGFGTISRVFVSPCAFALELT